MKYDNETDNTIMNRHNVSWILMNAIDIHTYVLTGT